MKVLLATCASWHLRQTARAFQNRDALAGLWITDKNGAGIPPEKYRRGWPFQLAMKPFYHFASENISERMMYRCIGFWKFWARSQLAASFPHYDAVQTIAGYGTEFFDHADRSGALKILDCANSHPVTYHGHWQRECDDFCTGEKIPIPSWFFERMSREIARADVVLCPSLFVRDTMLANGVAPEKCFISPFGVDRGVFTRRERVPEKPRFVCVGAVSLRKGHQYLFRAFARVKEKLPDAELICIGGYKHDFRHERERWAGTFTHHSLLQPADVARELRDSSAFVLASVEEGFARVLSEAMGAGLPIVATHESGASTLVRDGVEGFIVPARDPEKLAAAMIEAVADREKNFRMGEAAFARGAVQNDWQDYGDRLLAEYRRRLEEKKR
jgi:glycosyltransferase involved in cell wall biosynthesis